MQPYIKKTPTQLFDANIYYSHGILFIKQEIIHINSIKKLSKYIFINYKVIKKVDKIMFLFGRNILLFIYSTAHIYGTLKLAHPPTGTPRNWHFSQFFLCY